MTREEMMEEIEHYFVVATEQQRTIPLVQDIDRTWNFTQIIEQMRMGTEVGLLFVDNMIASRKQRQARMN